MQILIKEAPANIRKNDDLPSKMSRGMRFRTMWYVRPAKAQTSMRIRVV